MRINKKLFKISVLPLICVLTLASFLFGGEFLARKTADDGQNIRQILEQNPRGQVLGELENSEQNQNSSSNSNSNFNPKIQPKNNQNSDKKLDKNEETNEKIPENECPKNLPIIGWIDYSGSRVIKKELPIGQKPTICFKNTQDANLEGYFAK